MVCYLFFTVSEIIANTLGEEAGDYFFEDPCSLPIYEGDPCRGSAADPSYGFENGRCRQFYFSGCGFENANSFYSKEDCEKRCMK